MPHDQAYLEAEKKIEEALKSGATELDLSDMKLTELSDSLGQLTQLQSLHVAENQLTTLPESLLQLTQLQKLNLSENQLTTLPDSLGGLTQLQSLNLSENQLTTLPESLLQLTQLQKLNLSENQLTTLPDSLGQLTQLQKLDLSSNQLTALPDSLGQLTQLQSLHVAENQLTTLPESLGLLTNLVELSIFKNKLMTLPRTLFLLTNLKNLRMGENPFTKKIDDLEWENLKNLEEIQIDDIGLMVIPKWLKHLKNLKMLFVDNNQISDISSFFSSHPNLTWLSLGGSFKTGGNPLKTIPDDIGKLNLLEYLSIVSCELTYIPSSIAQLKNLETLDLSDNPLNPALKSAYEAGLDELKAYLRSLENAEPLYEAKLVLVGEGNVGKTTLLKALKGNKDEAPQKNEPTTHGVEIDIHGLRLPHPVFGKDGVEIQLNAWDFGGQDVYRVTHQFFFSRRSLYLLVWEPRNNVQQGRLDEWLDMIRLRVGDEARVIIVSTHSQSGGHLARIDKPVLQQQYGDMIVGFHEVDSLTPDETTGEMVGIAELKTVIAEQASQLEQMGMPFSVSWKAAQDELIRYPEPRISYTVFSEICAKHELTPIATKTLAQIMHDLGYIVHYSDDERLRDDVVLQPQWLTKAIGFVLEDRATQDAEGILPDAHLTQVWRDHSFKDEPRYDPALYPFFLRLMEKYDVSYRLPDGKSSLVAQHVPQVRPENLPWFPERETPSDTHRIAMVCSMDDDPPGLVPWMIVRTHDFSTEQNKDDGKIHHLHWQKGMFLTYPKHGEAFLEKRGREFHISAQADYPEYFMNVLQYTLQKLITDNWPGLEGRYRFSIPCPGEKDGNPCPGRFNLTALRQFLTKRVPMLPCQECYGIYSINELLHGFEERSIEELLREIRQEMNTRFDGVDSLIANYFMRMMRAMADEAKNGPRLFTLRSRDINLSWKQLISRPMELQLWCEHEGRPHPVIESGMGVYPIDQPYDLVTKAAPYVNFALGVLKTIAPMTVPAINIFSDPEITKKWKDEFDLAKAIVDKLPSEIKSSGHDMTPGKILSEPERSGILALHRFLNEVDPTQDKLGLHRVATYTGDFRWLCKHHYDAWQPNIPDVITPHE